MRKLLSAILTTLMLLCLVLFSACGGSSWEKPTLVDAGDVISQKGFIVETENYVYFINGVGDYKADNSFGAPVKGSLMVATKDSILAGDVEAQIVVPQLFVAEDIASGLFIYDGYVYYGTPSTDKKSSGDVANDQMTFARTKLDGSATDTYLTVGSLAYEYRIAEKDGVVYIVYYDDVDLALYSYNTSTGEKITITKTVSNVAGKYESLASYMFTEDNDDVVVAFTTTVYAEDYIPEKANLVNYSRLTAKHNYLYTYSVGDELASGNECYGNRILDGEDSSVKYELIMTKGEYVFYTQTDVYSNVKNMGATFDNIVGAQEVNNKDVLTTATLISSLEEAYFTDEDTNFVVKASLVGDVKQRENICSKETVTNLIDIFDGNLYFVDSNNCISRLEVGNGNADVVKVSNGTIDNTWYAPEILSFGGKNFMFYLDNTTAGSSYVRFVDLDSEVQEETTGEEGEEVTTYFLAGDILLGQMTDADRVNAVIEAIDGIESTLKHTTDTEGNFTVESYTKALALYNEIKDDKGVMEYLEDSYVEKLESVGKSVRLGELYYALKDFTADNREDFRDAYDLAKAYRAELLEGGIYQETRDMLEEELKYYFQEAAKIFDPVIE